MILCVSLKDCLKAYARYCVGQFKISFNDLFNEIAQEMGDDSYFDTLSMGMSSDLEAAIYENTNIVRVGTDIFGPRE